MFPIKETICNRGDNLVYENSGNILLTNQFIECVATGEKIKFNVTPEAFLETKKYFDKACAESANDRGPEIISAKNFAYYSAGLNNFGSTSVVVSNCNPYLKENITLRFFTPPNEHPANYGDENGEDISYKIFCIDIDGIAYGEEPFGYGVRADGKVLTGAKADEWLKK